MWTKSRMRTEPANAELYDRIARPAPPDFATIERDGDHAVLQPLCGLTNVVLKPIKRRPGVEIGRLQLVQRLLERRREARVGPEAEQALADGFVGGVVVVE